jgi:hypothetical protein
MKITKGVALVFTFLLFCFSALLLSQAQASITLRVVAANPSDEINQSVPIKVYLPMEVKPEDIIYKDDLGVAYDTQQGSYYVFGDYDLKPKEVLEKEIEIKDIWVIEGAQIVALRKETQDMLKAFEKTEFADKAAILFQSVEKKLVEVENIQRVSSNSPTTHISDYRYCLSLLSSAKADLLAAKTLLAEVTPKGLAKVTWKIVIFIIVFLGVLSLGFYLIWQRQAKLETEEKRQEEVNQV